MAEGHANENKGIKTFKFILYAAIGIFMFFVPVTIGEKSTIPIDHIVGWIQSIPNYGPIYSGLIVTIGALLPFINKSWKKDKASIVFSFIGLLGVIFVFMAIFNVGPEFLMRSYDWFWNVE